METNNGIEPHVLFNLIGMRKPLAFLDYRDNESFNKCRIMGSYSVPEEMTDIRLELKQIITRVHSKKSLHLVMAYNTIHDMNSFMLQYNNIQSAVFADGNQNVNEERKTGFEHIHSIHYVCFDIFYELYSDCICVFEGSEVIAVKKGHAECYPTEIIPGFLFLGDYRDGTDETTLKGLHITHVVDATGEQTSQNISEQLSLQYLEVQIWDLPDEDIAAHFNSVISFIQSARQNRGRVLVHCRAGISRSATFVLAYIIHSDPSSTLDQAVRTVLTARPYVCPNVTFRRQLREYEFELRGVNSLASDEAMLAVMRSLSPSWEGMFQTETDHDRVPILAGRNLDPSLALLDEFPSEGATFSDEGQKKPKKPFLKRGAGKKRAI